MSPGQTQTAPVVMSGPASALVASIAAVVINATVIVRSFPMPPRVATRLWHHAFDAGQCLALGLVGAGISAIFLAKRPEKRPMLFAFVGLAAVSLATGALTLPSDLDNAAARFANGRGELFGSAILWAMVSLTSLSVPLAWSLGRLLARPIVRWLGIAAGYAALAANPGILPNDYLGVHLFITLASGALFASCLAGAIVPARLASLTRKARILGKPSLACASLLASFSLVAAPYPSVSKWLIASQGAVLAPFLLRLHAKRSSGPVDLSASAAAYYDDRKSAPPVPPSTPALFGKNPAVIVLSIDCLRADVLASRKNDKQLPTLASLRDRSMYFVNARSPGSQTVYSLTSMFAGTHFSEQHWSKTNLLGGRGNWPSAEQSPRFPSLLTKAGVTSVTYGGAAWLTEEFGVLRGFSENSYVQPNNTYFTAASLLVDRAIQRLASVKDEPFFLYIHFIDAHVPYDLSPVQGPPFARYVGELGLVDTEINRLIRAVAQSSIARRVTYVVTADHGEAFGEHNRYQHANSLYDELLRVPLMIQMPVAEARVVTEPVSLVDLGPTMLDLFGQPTPGFYVGQSLVPFLRGESPTLDRPIIAETRLMRALVLRDGMKVIADDRNNTIELYDLAKDPAELFNIVDDDARLMRPLSLLRRYFASHTRTEGGYEPPYQR